MIGRRAFVTALTLGAAFLPRSARATGGLDPELDTPPPRSTAPSLRNPAVRVLVANNVDARAFSAAGGAMFSFAGKTYRGGPALVDGPDRRQALVATLPLDAYLYGVVPLEIGKRWPDAALQAQAIVARTYALAHRSSGRAYDLVAHEGDQVWGTIDDESPETNGAVDATSGQIVSFGGGLASVFYGSCCGGHTADATHLWGSADLPYLRGVPDPYCLSASPDARWTTTLSVGQLVSALTARLAPVGTIRSIVLRDPQPDERRALAIAGTTGSLELSSAQVRLAVGPRILRSGLWRSLTVQGDPALPGTQIVIEGAGRGHGVGLCQWGARVMAQQGRSARDIVAFYFPGTQITMS